MKSIIDFLCSISGLTPYTRLLESKKELERVNQELRDEIAAACWVGQKNDLLGTMGAESTMRDGE